MSTEIDYNAVLADLEAKRAALDNAIATVRQLVNLGAELSVGVSRKRGTNLQRRFVSILSFK